jgi:predicted CXXCH cytochrome family protein
LLGGATFLLVAVAAAGILWASGLWSPPPPPPQPPAKSPPPAEVPPDFPLPAVSPSPFLNTRAGATYVGSDACHSCHKSRTASFRRTGMGCSMAAVDPAREPADGAFDHVKSRSRFQIVRKDGKLWHRELLLTNDATEIVLAEHAVTHVIGSGHYARTYVAEVDGFLVESPVTWYASGKGWQMSPGYDRREALSFARGIGENCLGCHAGRAEALSQSQHRMRIVEGAISCERCHGPGSLHLGQHKNAPADADDGPGGGIDYTIVNPKRLPRERAEAVCQQCHLHAAATVLGRSKKHTDYRPGLAIEDFRQDYVLEGGGADMTVVGHVEQMHLSRCYLESKTLTCTTCHNPHAFPAPDQRLDHYRNVCLSCHKTEECKVKKEHLLKESPANYCVQCHMPTAATEIPHVAFTHHRIAVHEKLPKTKPGQASPGTLRLFLENARLGPMDRKRSLGLAYLQLTSGDDDPALNAHYLGLAVKLLAEVQTAGLRDSLMEVALARRYFEMNKEQAVYLAESALLDKDLSGPERCAALFVVAGERLRHKRMKAARDALLELVTLRRHPDDWLLLATCQQALGNAGAYIEALQTAVRINPRLREVHQVLAQHFRQKGDAERADYHQKRAGA